MIFKGIGKFSKEIDIYIYFLWLEMCLVKYINKGYSSLKEESLVS